MEFLTNEQRLIVYLSRVTLSTEKEKIVALVEGELDWFEVLKQSLINRVTGLMYSNLERLNLAGRIKPPIVYQAFRFYYLSLIKKNTVFLAEAKKISDTFRQLGIPAFPLKGASLVGDIYQDQGSRSMNDLDFLFDYNYMNEVITALNSLGFVQGEFDLSTKKINEYSRKKRIAWSVKMNSIPSLVKMTDEETSEAICIDLSFSLNLQKDLEPVAEIISKATDAQIAKEHFFVHLCTHLHKEAVNAIWIINNSDVNLIKFCDVREYILAYIDLDTYRKAVEFVKKHKLEKSIYYTIYYLKLIYGDGYEDEYLSLLEIEDDEFLHELTSDEQGNMIKSRKTFWEKVFSASNANELAEKTKLVDNYKDYMNY